MEWFSHLLSRYDKNGVSIDFEKKIMSMGDGFMMFWEKIDKEIVSLDVPLRLTSPINRMSKIKHYFSPKNKKVAAYYNVKRLKQILSGFDDNAFVLLEMYPAPTEETHGKGMLLGISEDTQNSAARGAVLMNGVPPEFEPVYRYWQEQAEATAITEGGAQ